MRSLELFAGTGGLALGIHAAGFNHVALIEKNALAAETLRENSQDLLQLPPDFVLERDAKDVDYSVYSGQVDLLAGGPPCQPFSTAGKALGPKDDRNMFPVFLSAVRQILPKAILIENVKGLLRSRFRDYFDYVLCRMRYPLCAALDGEEWTAHYGRLQLVTSTYFPPSERYEVTWQLVDSADYGVPQRRERVIITGFRADLGLAPEQLAPTHSKESLFVQQWITGDYWLKRGIESHDYLTKRDKRLRDALKEAPLLAPSLEPWRTVRDAITDLPPCVERGEDPKFANHVQHPGARVYTNHIGSYNDYPAKALKAGTHGTPGGENMLRLPTGGVRYFTTREAARLQTFPDAWQFHGSWGSCIRQLGNAVPVKLACVFASHIYRALARGADVIGEKANDR